MAGENRGQAGGGGGGRGWGGDRVASGREADNMAQVSYEEVNLMLRLYDMRREPRLRQARAWFVENFHPTSAEDMMQKYPKGSEENAYIRMVISYWDMVARIVNRGLINDELFFESNGEIWVVWDRLRTIVPIWRGAFKNPRLFANIEETYKRLEAWREKHRTRSSAAMPKLMAPIITNPQGGSRAAPGPRNPSSARCGAGTTRRALPSLCL